MTLRKPVRFWFLYDTRPVVRTDGRQNREQGGLPEVEREVWTALPQETADWKLQGSEYCYCVNLKGILNLAGRLGQGQGAA